MIAGNPEIERKPIPGLGLRTLDGHPGQSHAVRTSAGPRHRGGLRPPSDDITRCYLDEIGRLPRLTDDEELRLAWRLERLRRRQRRRLFACPYVVRLAFDALGEVERGGLRLNQVLELPPTRGSAAEFRQRRLPELMQRLRGWLSRNDRDVRIFVSRSRSMPIRRRARRRMLRRCRVASRLLSRLPWRFDRLQHMLQEYTSMASRFQRRHAEFCRQRDDQPDSIRARRAARTYYARLIRAQEGVRATQRRLSILRRIDAEREQARSRLVESNLRLVVAIAKGYRHCGSSLLDIVQDGNAGILRAAEKFDPRRGVNFGSYAGWWIRQSIRRSSRIHPSAIYIPEKGWVALWKLREWFGELSDVYRRPPRVEELAAAAGISVPETRRLVALDAPLTALDAPCGGDEVNVREQLYDPSAEQPETIVDRRQLSDRMDRMMAILPPKERRIIELRFGFEDGHRHTLADVGRIFKLSGEWVRKLEAAALDKLRSPNCREQLRGFLDAP